jgi:predicted DsbA family dithiol-disulfide isomerase
LGSIKTAVEGGLAIQWKAFSLDQINSTEDPGFKIWEEQEYASSGTLALVASKCAENQGEESFLAFHLATFEARHDRKMDISDIQVLKRIARDSGLDVARFEKDIARRENWRRVGRDHIESRKRYGVFGVPTLVFPKGESVFVKLEAIPESQEERLALFNLIFEMGDRMPYLLELKRP